MICPSGVNRVLVGHRHSHLAANWTRYIGSAREVSSVWNSTRAAVGWLLCEVHLDHYTSIGSGDGSGTGTPVRDGRKRGIYCC